MLSNASFLSNTDALDDDDENRENRRWTDSNLQFMESIKNPLAATNNRTCSLDEMVRKEGENAIYDAARCLRVSPFVRL